MSARLPWVLFIGLSLAGCAGEEVTQCTTEPRSAWQDADAFQQSLLDQGYRINEFKITEGNCYEIYGFDPEQKKVEIYYNPVDGSVVKREEG
ncbi:MAG TPA: PepSY domain-containing protein [Pseudomonadales bacterium]